MRSVFYSILGITGENKCCQLNENGDLSICLVVVSRVVNIKMSFRPKWRNPSYLRQEPASLPLVVGRDLSQFTLANARAQDDSSGFKGIDCHILLENRETVWILPG